MWITLAAWLMVTIGLFAFAPSAKDYDVSSIQTLPDNAKSVIANKELNKYFKDDQGVPALLVFSSKSGKADTQTISQAMDVILKENIKGVKEAVPFSSLPPQAQAQLLLFRLTLKVHLNQTKLKLELRTYIQQWKISRLI